MRVLVTGGAGYIGSHAAKRLLSLGHEVLIVDDLSRGTGDAVETLRGWAAESGCGERLWFERARVQEEARLGALLRERAVEAVMHFAAFAYVDESIERPLEYHENNAWGALALLRACAGTGVERFVLSSTCAVYGAPGDAPVTERTPCAPITPYGWSKLYAERVGTDALVGAQREGRAFAFAALRYFNVAGCDHEGVLGERLEGCRRLIPNLVRSALAGEAALKVYGDDYETRDGTCVRDFVHVDDLVEAHVLTLGALEPARHDLRTYNVGTGEGVSVLEAARAVERVLGRGVRLERVGRRPGDAPSLVADASLIARELGWEARSSEMGAIVETVARWQMAK
ncbi:MAG: UDP-glucose 4-epimerase GalE [Phycisphaerales bacterium]|nr:MAG: UDP-glucose 4-epimerase GalE [Phycisphaerales bacterium]